MLGGDEMESIWLKDIRENTEHPAQSGPADTGRKSRTDLPPRAEVAVIGAGMAGMLCACMLADQGADVAVLEARVAGHGQTKNTTAKITSQHGLIYDKLVRTMGHDRALLYARANQSAVEEYERMIRARNIDCGFVRLPACLYSKEERGRIHLEKEYRAAVSLGLPAVLTSDTSLPFPVTEALLFENQAQFHPLKFLEAVREGIPVFEHTAVQKVEGHRLITDRGIMEAEKIIFASHYPFQNVPGFYFARMHQERSYVLALEAAGGKQVNLDGMYYGVDEDGLSFRKAGPYILMGGGGHRTGEGCDSFSFEYLRGQARTLWPDFRIVSEWAAQDCMTLDAVPYIGKYSRLRPYWYVASGFQKWGMTGSMVSALILRNLVMGIESPWEQVFSPQRWTWKASAGSFLKEGYHALRGLTAFGTPRCPHMGCRLSWNQEEHSWDCPCHGSRFSENGSLIDNPAQTDLKADKR